MTQTEYTLPLQREIDFAFYPRVPLISLELTNYCNLKCPYCSNNSLTRPKGYIKAPLLEKIINECAEKHYDLACLHGVGEPLLWNGLEDVISLIKRKGAGKGSFGTNGTLLTSDRVKKLLDAGLDSIYVSIDTLDPEIYAATRGGKVEKVIQNVQEMIRIVPKTFQITIALMDHKDQRITNEITDNFYSVFGRHENVTLNIVANCLFPSAEGDYRTSQAKVQRCNASVNYLFIALDGRAAICCLDQDLLHSIGNIGERSIQDVWFDPHNQTTFRNLAMGIFDCPSTCTERCNLLSPRQDLVTVSAGLNMPFGDAAQFYISLLAKGEKVQASNILQALIARDPVNHGLRKAYVDLTSQL